MEKNLLKERVKRKMMQSSIFHILLKAEIKQINRHGMRYDITNDENAVIGNKIKSEQ